jgi:hypothetical protein
MNPEVNSIKISLEALKQALEDIQSKCSHLQVEKTHGGDTGNYDPSNDHYWTEFHCLVCDKRWTEDGSK